MKPDPTETPSQRLIGTVLILLATIAVILLFKQLEQRPLGRSRVDWPTHAP